MTRTATTYHPPTDLPAAEVVDVAEQLGIDFTIAPFSIEDLKLGMEVELEQERFVAAAATATIDADDDLAEIGMVAIAHLQAQPDFYTMLTQVHAPGDPAPPSYEHADVGTD